MFVLVSVKQYDTGGLVGDSWRRGRREAAGTARSGAPQQGTGNLDGGGGGAWRPRHGSRSWAEKTEREREGH